jgi:hypothetical protein
MAIRLNNGGTSDYVYFDGSAAPLRIVGDSVPFTMACWARIRGGAGNRRVISKIGSAQGFTSAMHALRAETSNVFQINNGSSSEDMVAVTADQWFYLVTNPTGVFGGNGYYGTTTTLTLSSGLLSTSAAMGHLMVGAYDASGSDAAPVEVAHLRCWQATLTKDELEDEMVSTTSVITTNLWLAWEFVANANDGSGNGRNGTVNGSTFSYVDGPTLTAPGSVLTRQRGLSGGMAELTGGMRG